MTDTPLAIGLIRLATPRDHPRRMPSDPRAPAEVVKPARPADDPGQPDTVAEIDPDVAQLLGLRAADAGPLPTADELDTLGEITDTRIYEGELEARAPGGDQPDEDPAQNLE